MHLAPGCAPKRYSISRRKGENGFRPAAGAAGGPPPEAKTFLRFQRFHTHIFTANADCPPHRSRTHHTAYYLHTHDSRQAFQATPHPHSNVSRPLVSMAVATVSSTA
eukprot:1953568-Prymnesium_polylepis.1